MGNIYPYYFLIIPKCLSKRAQMQLLLQISMARNLLFKNAYIPALILTCEKNNYCVVEILEQI